MKDKTPRNSADLRRLAEERLSGEQISEIESQTGIELDDSEAISPQEIRKILHELSVHQTELEIQNEELRMSQTQIEAGRARYFDLYDLAPVGYCILSEKGIILEANLTVAKMLEITNARLVMHPISRFIIKEDQDIYYLHRRKLFETGEPQECELRLVKSGGMRFWAHMAATAVQADDGEQMCRLVISDITAQKHAEQEIQKQLTEKETLLREVHHRVKNNITSLESLLNLQANSADNPEAKEAINSAVSRVRTMRILYDKLLISNDIYEIRIKNYIENLIDSIHEVFADNDNIIIEKQISDFRIISKQAITIGIIINELLTNVLKYAFEGRDKGTVFVTIKKTENKVTVIIQDNGVGIDETILENKSLGFGLTIVKMLVEQLNGTYNIVNDNGTRSVLEFQL